MGVGMSRSMASSAVASSEALARGRGGCCVGLAAAAAAYSWSRSDSAPHETFRIEPAFITPDQPDVIVRAIHDFEK